MSEVPLHGSFVNRVTSLIRIHTRVPRCVNWRTPVPWRRGGMAPCQRGTTAARGGIAWLRARSCPSQGAESTTTSTFDLPPLPLATVCAAGASLSLSPSPLLSLCICLSPPEACLGGGEPWRRRPRVRGLLEGSGFRVQGSGFKVQGSGFRVSCFGLIAGGEGWHEPERGAPLWEEEWHRVEG